MRRFWDKVEKTDGCWNWTAAKAGNGYGVLRLSDPRRMVYAHRLSYEMAHGPIPEGEVVRHRCDNPACVNPDHLLLGTQADNVRDAVKRGSHNSGHEILTRDDIPIIRRRLADGELHKDIAADYDVCRATISQIARGANWSGVI